MRTRLTVLAVVFLTTLIFSLTPVAASSVPADEWKNFNPLSWIVDLLPGGWIDTLPKYGAEFDPNGESSDYGPAADPDGTPSDYGPGLDPNGADLDGD